MKPLTKEEKRIGFLILAFFSYIAFITALLLFGVKYTQAICDNKQSEEKQECPTYDLYEFPFAWIIKTADAHNGLLSAVFALVLIFVTNRQAKLTERANNTAQKSADAATRAAEVAVAVELPIFAIETVNASMGVERCSITLTNHGKSPAILKADCLTYKIASALPEKPRYPLGSREKVDLGRVVTATSNYLIQRNLPISQEDWIEVLKGSTILWIFGYIDYVDFLKIKRRDGFCVGLRPARHIIDPEQFSFDGFWCDEGPDPYTFTKVIAEDDST